MSSFGWQNIPLLQVQLCPQRYFSAKKNTTSNLLQIASEMTLTDGVSLIVASSVKVLYQVKTPSPT